MSKTPYHFLGSDPNVANMLSIFCRIKPVKGSEPCFTMLNSTTLLSHIPNCNISNKQFTFQRVFPADSTQKQVFDEVAFPLVQQLLHGRNSLLFTYGNTGSGKTFTMKGTLQEGGIMPRCLDVIFNSLSQKLARKNVFKSDKFNGYEIQSEKQAALDSNQALIKQIALSKGSKTKNLKKHNSDPDLATRLIDPTQILLINNKNTFAVFVTFIEIYNNNAYDLLDDSSEDSGPSNRAPQTKVIREDSRRNMFVHGVTEVEVSSTEEAYEVFYRGLKKRHTAQTLLNAQSSRSHSVFTIRLVQANLSVREVRKGKMDRSPPSVPITVGLLSLVDLAGSERLSRTHNTGKKLVEAGNINNSLMTLRQCFEALRENQRGASRVVPYRDSKLTTLFKSYFEGEGTIAMIVCLNAHKDDFEETQHVLKFAESSRDIQITLSAPKQLEMEDANRAKRLESRIERIDSKLSEVMNNNKVNFQMEPWIEQGILKLGNLDFPTVGSTSEDLFSLPGLDEGLAALDPFLDKNKNDITKLDNMTEGVTSIIRKYCLSNLENQDLKNSMRREKTEILKEKSKMDGEIYELKRKLEDSNGSVKRLKRDLMEKEKAVLKTRAEKDKEKERFQIKKTIYKEKYNSELEKRLRRQRTHLEMELQSKENQLAQVQRVLSDEIISTCSTPSVASCRAKFENFATPSSVSATPKITHSEMRPNYRRNAAVSNRRHRRSRSAGDVWVEHKPAMPVPLNTVLQPSLPKRRSITKLTNAKQVTQGASKYCLITQTQDSAGELETRLYKGDVIPTSGGGAQVLFDDVEVLKQESPDASPKILR